MVIVYKCKYSNAELFDDCERIEEDFNGEVLKVYSKKIRDEAEEDEVFVNNIVSNYRYTPSELQKKDFLIFFKQYAKKILDDLKEQQVGDEVVAKFQAESTNFAKFIVANYDQCEFYQNDFGVDHPVSAMGIAFWAEECTDAPIFYYLKAAIKMQKV